MDPQRLFKNNRDRFPLLHIEWDTEENIKSGVDFDTITCHSAKKVNWICSERGHRYTTKMYVRTTNGSRCKECHLESIRVYDKEAVTELRNTVRPKSEATSIGDATEEFVRDILADTGIYKAVNKVGDTGSGADIEVLHFDNSINFIQVKTIVTSKRSYLTARNNIKYEDNMLMAFVNKERTVFSVAFYREVKDLLAVYFSLKPNSKHSDKIYIEIEDFIAKLIELIPLSTTVNRMTDDQNKEYESLNRLKLFCENRGVSYERNTTNGDCVDGRVNGYTFQAKFSSFNGSNTITYHLGIVKNAGILNGKRMNKPYAVGDFDFLIIEVGGTREEPEKYKGNFCIIPQSALIEHGCLKSATCDGKVTMSVAPPDYTKPQWTNKFWNNTDQLVKKH